jgi:hypothetical protein
MQPRVEMRAKVRRESVAIDVPRFAIEGGDDGSEYTLKR